MFSRQGRRSGFCFLRVCPRTGSFLVFGVEVLWFGTGTAVVVGIECLVVVGFILLLFYGVCCYWGRDVSLARLGVCSTVPGFSSGPRDCDLSRVCLRLRMGKFRCRVIVIIP